MKYLAHQRIKCFYLITNLCLILAFTSLFFMLFFLSDSVTKPSEGYFVPNPSTSCINRINSAPGIKESSDLSISSFSKIDSPKTPFQEELIISQENGNQTFNCALGACTCAQEIIPQRSFNATKLGFLFGGTGSGNVTISLRTALDGPILAITETLNILTNGNFTEGLLNTTIELTEGIKYYFQIDSNVPETILFCFGYGNPYPYGIAHCKVSYGWTSNNPQNGDYAFRIYGYHIEVDAILPSIDSPLDVTYVVGTTEHTINWSVSDMNPDEYHLYRNSTLIKNGTWTSGKITFNIDGLTIGIYNFTLAVSDITGNWNADSVLVIVKPVEPTESISSPSVTVRSFGFLLVLMGLSAFVTAFRRRNR